MSKTSDMDVQRQERVFSGSIDAMKEVARMRKLLTTIEDITNSDAEHDADYSAVCDKVNVLARIALWPIDEPTHLKK